jgi:hypothetical protein
VPVCLWVTAHIKTNALGLGISFFIIEIFFKSKMEKGKRSDD